MNLIKYASLRAEGFVALSLGPEKSNFNVMARHFPGSKTSQSQKLTANDAEYGLAGTVKTSLPVR